MDPGRVSRSQELSRLVSGLSFRVRRFQGKEGSFQGKGGRKLPTEWRKEASKGREERSFLQNGGRKVPRESTFILVSLTSLKTNLFKHLIHSVHFRIFTSAIVF